MIAMWEFHLHLYVIPCDTIVLVSTLCITVIVFLISLYSAPLAQRASYLALHGSLFWPVAQLIIIILSLTALTLW